MFANSYISTFWLWNVVCSDEVRPFLYFFNPKNRLLAEVRGFSIFPHEHLSLIPLFRKPPIDLLLTFNSEKQDKILENI